MYWIENNISFSIYANKCQTKPLHHQVMSNVASIGRMIWMGHKRSWNFIRYSTKTSSHVVFQSMSCHAARMCEYEAFKDCLKNQNANICFPKPGANWLLRKWFPRRVWLSGLVDEEPSVSSMVVSRIGIFPSDYRHGVKHSFCFLCFSEYGI